MEDHVESVVKVERLGVNCIGAHEFVRVSGSMIAVSYEASWVGLTGTSWQSENDPCAPGQVSYVVGRGRRINARAKGIVGVRICH